MNHDTTHNSEQDSRGTISKSSCKMYNITAVQHLPVDDWKFTENDTMCEATEE